MPSAMSSMCLSVRRAEVTGRTSHVSRIHPGASRRSDTRTSQAAGSRVNMRTTALPIVPAPPVTSALLTRGKDTYLFGPCAQMSVRTGSFSSRPRSLTTRRRRLRAAIVTSTRRLPRYARACSVYRWQFCDRPRAPTHFGEVDYPALVTVQGGVRGERRGAVAVTSLTQLGGERSILAEADRLGKQKIRSVCRDNDSRAGSNDFLRSQPASICRRQDRLARGEIGRQLAGDGHPRNTGE